MKDQIEIDQNLLKISTWKQDWIPVDRSFELDEEVALIVKGQVRGIEYDTNNDGTADKIHIIKGLIAIDKNEQK